MKKILLALLIGLPALLLGQDQKPYETKSLSGQSIKNIELQTSGGSLSVSASSSTEARLEIYIRGNNGKDDLSREEIKARLDERYELNVSVSGNKLVATARQKKEFKDWKKALSISFRVYVPKDVSTELRTSGGSINLSGISGTQDFATSGGSLHVNDVSGKINGRTSGGSIHVESCSSENIDLSTSGGSIHAKNCSGTLRLNTSGGSVNLTELKGNIRATTSGGSIKGDNISGELYTQTSGGGIRLSELSCSLETSTSGGNIDVSIATLGKFIKIRNSGGSISLELPKGKGMDLSLVGNKVRTGQLTNFTGRANDDEIEGTVNGGGIPVDVRAGSGRVSLAFK
jgi:DUF4097 and DUF4098 domain-containing protein YvlB